MRTTSCSAVIQIALKLKNASISLKNAQYFYLSKSYTKNKNKFIASANIRRFSERRGIQFDRRI